MFIGSLGKIGVAIDISCQALKEKFTQLPYWEGGNGYWQAGLLSQGLCVNQFHHRFDEGI